MKKTMFAVLLILTLICTSAMAAPAGYQSDKNYMCEDFEDADNSMIGQADSPVARAFDKHDMDPYYYADGTMEITGDGENGSKGLKLIPDYHSDLAQGSNVILRTQLQRVCSTLDASKQEEVKNAWASAKGFSFYVRNTTEAELACVPGLYINLADGSTIALGSGLNTLLIETDGTSYEPDFVDGWSNSSFFIPAEFEGWVVLQNRMGEHDDYEASWSVQPWEDEAKLDMDGAEFANVAMFQIDFRLNVSGLDESGYIMVDSFELFGDAADADSTPTPKPDVTGTASSATATTASGTTQPSGNNPLSTGAIIGIAAGAVVIIAAVIVIAVIVKKRKKAE